MRVIKVEHLSRNYGNGRGIFDLSFSVEEGESFGFLGPNGAGKTTTIRHLMGFLKPEAGACSINGLDCWANRTAIQQKLGYIPGEISFFDDMTGNDFLKFYSSYRNLKANSRMNELINRFELDVRGKIKKMSKGTKQKVGIVAAFMHDPEVLILDEPTSGLDPLMQNRFIELILEEKQKGKTILMSSHIFEEVERTCHRVCIIKEGRLVAVNSVDALKASQAKKFTVTFQSEEAAADFAAKWEKVAGISRNQVTLIAQQNINDLIALLHNYNVDNLVSHNQSLEEIFLQYYGGGTNA